PARFHGNVHEHAIQEVGDRVALADDLHPVPLADRLVDVGRASEPEHVLPIRGAPPPVEATGFQGLPLSPLLIIRLAVRPDPDLGGEGRDSFLAWDHNQVATSALEDLAFDRGHPARERLPVGPDAMYHDPRVPRPIAARGPGLSPPL